MLDELHADGMSTVMVGYLLGLVNVMEARGVDAADVLKCAGIRNTLSNDPLNRFPSSLFSGVYNLSVEATRDPYIGLHAARSMKAPDLHVVGLGLLASGSMLSFCRRLEKLLPVITGAGRVSLEEKPSTYRLLTKPYGPMCPSVQDSWLAFLYGLMCQMHSPTLKPVRVELMHKRPAGGIDPYVENFNAPVSFGHDACVMEFTKTDVLQPLRSGCEDLANVQDISALGYLTRLNTGDVIARVQQAIVDSLKESGTVSVGTVTAKLRLGSRQLHKRLTDRHTNFQTVLDQTRLFLAKGKLNDPEVPITDIAYMLGFTDSANFSRAFRRWTGKSPRRYRNRAAQTAA